MAIDQYEEKKSRLLTKSLSLGDEYIFIFGRGNKNNQPQGIWTQSVSLVFFYFGIGVEVINDQKDQ